MGTINGIEIIKIVVLFGVFLIFGVGLLLFQIYITVRFIRDDVNVLPTWFRRYCCFWNSVGIGIAVFGISFYLLRSVTDFSEYLITLMYFFSMGLGPNAIFKYWKKSKNG